MIWHCLTMLRSGRVLQHSAGQIARKEFVRTLRIRAPNWIERRGRREYRSARGIELHHATVSGFGNIYIDIEQLCFYFL
jgi:hypothetical protein